MKWSILVGLGVVGIAAVSSAVLMTSGKLPDVNVVATENGITSLKVSDLEVLKNGDFSVDSVLLKKKSGETYQGSTAGRAQFDKEHLELTKTFPWGILKVGYAASKNRLTISMTTTNTSDSETIQGVKYVPITLRFPEKLKEYDGTTPLLAHNLGQVADVAVSYGSGKVSVVSEDLDKPLMVGFPWANDRPASTEYPLSVHTDRVNSYPDSYPTLTRPIPPKGTDTFVVSLRFGKSGTSDAKLVGDMYQKYAEVFPVQLKWTDHRPIGAIFLASAGQKWASNPRGWFNDPAVNVMTATGKQQFRERLLSWADTSIGIMRDMNAQGAVTWDPEGQEFPSGTSYVGDPRMVETMAPEMKDVVDEYFERFHKAGFRVGICVRPQEFHLSADKTEAKQMPVLDPTQLLIDKIAYAKKRWGITMVYLDSNTNSTDPNPLDVSIIQKVATAFPEILIIPEHSNLRYYAYSAPYKELSKGLISTPGLVRETYPNASSTIYTADGPLDLYRDGLTDAVKRGDMLMYRTWYTDPQNEKVKALYKK
jgi:hypothetical protein